MLFKYPSKDKLTDDEIARLGMEAELDAVNFYQQLASMTSNKLLRETLLNIAEEEKVHFGEFLSNVIDTDDKSIKDGVLEVCKRAKNLGIDHLSCRWL